MTLERCLIAFSYWTDPFANERLIGTDRAQDYERVINREKKKNEDNTGGEEGVFQKKRCIA